MGRVEGPTVEPPEGAKKTLGDLLYATPPGTARGEAAWVELVRSVAAGDQRALHALYERAHRPVFTLAFRIVPSRETAEEVTVDVFHDVWRRASAYDPAGGPVLGWIMNQARSRAIDRLRFDQRKKRSPASDAAVQPPPEVYAPDQALGVAQEGRKLRDALAVLTEDERTAIETAFFAEMTYDEVATRLNQPLGTVKTRVRSGLGKLRQVLGGEESPG